MSRSPIEEVVESILEVHATPEHTAAAETDSRTGAAWDQLVELGFSRATLPEHVGGGDLDFGDGSSLLLSCGRHAAFVPMAENAFLGGWLLATAGLDVPEGLVTSGPIHHDQCVDALREGDDWVLSGAADIPWAGQADRLAVLAWTTSGAVLASVDPALVSITPGANVAGEPRDSVDFSGARVPADQVVELGEAAVEAYWRRGALTRVLLAQGAMESVLHMTLLYAGQREQFGRAISSFQAVAQHLAVMAREVELCRSAVDLAVARTSHGTADDNALEVAAARVRVATASAEVARLAHQVHGAIGVTREYALQLHTRRLWAWRDEFGDETHWAHELGGLVTKSDEGAWALLTSRPGVHTVGAS